MAPRRKRQRLDEPLGIAQPSTTGEKSADELRLEAELFAFAPQQVDGPTLRETEGAEDDLEEVADDQVRL